MISQGRCVRSSPILRSILLVSIGVAAACNGQTPVALDETGLEAQQPQGKRGGKGGGPYCDGLPLTVGFADRTSGTGLMSDGAGPIPPGANVYSDLEEGVGADITPADELRLWLRDAPQRGIDLLLGAPVWKISGTYQIEGVDEPVGYDRLVDAKTDEGGQRPGVEEAWRPTDVWMISELTFRTRGFRDPDCTVPDAPGPLLDQDLYVLFYYDGLWRVNFEGQGSCEFPENEPSLPGASDQAQPANVAYEGGETWTMGLNRAMLCRSVSLIDSNTKGKSGKGRNAWAAVGVFDVPGTLTLQPLP